MSKQEVQHKEGSAQVEQPIQRWDGARLKSVLKSRFERLARASNLSNAIREKTEPERVQIAKINKRIATSLKKAVDENTSYKVVLSTVNGHEAKIKQIRETVKSKTETERTERQECVKEARQLDKMTAIQVMTDPSVSALSRSDVAELIE